MRFCHGSLLRSNIVTKLNAYVLRMMITTIPKPTEEEKQERRRLYQRLYQADRRAGERALNSIFNQQHAQECREALAKGKAEFDQRTAH